MWDDGAGGHNDFGSITMDAAGRCYVASGGTIPAAGAPGLFTLRLSSALAVAWTRTVIADSEVEDVQVEATGRSRVTASGIADPPTSISSVVAQYGSGGGLRWTSVLPGTPAYIGQFLAASPDGSVSLAGMQSDFLESTSVLAHWSP